MIPTISGRQLHLRPMGKNDADALFGLFSDPVAMRYWSFLPYTELSQAEAHLTRNAAFAEKRENMPWGIEKDGQLVGTVTLHDMNLECGRAEIGYMLARSLWGQGHAREAATLAIDHAFGPLGLRRLEADIDPRNLASQKLLERLGFVREGVLRERWKVGDEISDTALYGLLKRDWEEERA